MSAVTITGFAPSWSSSAPTAIVEMPATTLAAIAKMITSPGREAEDGCREHAAEGEDAGQAVAEDRAREQEPDRVAGLAPEPRDVAAEARVGGEEADLLALRAGAAVLGHGEQHREGEQAEPDRRDDHRDADGQAVLVRNAEEAPG